MLPEFDLLRPNTIPEALAIRAGHARRITDTERARAEIKAERAQARAERQTARAIIPPFPQMGTGGNGKHGIPQRESIR